MRKTTDEVIPVPFTNRAAVQAASHEIDSLIAARGVLSEAECIKIMQDKMQVVNHLERYLPGCVTSATLLEQVKSVLEERGYNDDNTLFAQSVCPDEVNHEEGDVTDLFAKHWGEVFHMGGLAGLPFTGKTGFKAFSSHVPDDGHCFVLMAPHVGMDDNGNLGSYSRIGQEHAGTCCGAAVGALKYCISCSDPPSPSDCPLDYQMQFILQQVYKAKDALLPIEDKNQQQSELVTHLHDVSHDMLANIANVGFGNSKSTLVVLTGVQINMPRPFHDFFQPLSFYIMKKDGSREDLMEFLR